MGNDWESSDETAPTEAPAREIQFAQYWAIIVKRWRLIALCVVLCLIAATVYSLMAKQQFQAVAVLEISSVGSSPLEANAMGQRGAASDSEFLPTQMRLMKSRQVAERVEPDFGIVDVRSVRHLNCEEHHCLG